ncbi:MAG: helix-turn-helix transcriptional regulator [bacterium]
MDSYILKSGSEKIESDDVSILTSILSDNDSKIISFPIEEYLKTFKEEPDGFEITNIIAQALGCFCFCVAASEFLKDIKIKPSFEHPECDFTYILSDFEKNHLNVTSLVRKNKFLASKNYAVNFEKGNVISGKAFINYNLLNESSIKLKIKIDFENLKTSELKDMNILFELIWSKLQPQINKAQRPCMQKTINCIPDYLKFATAPFMQELRRLMTSQNDKIFIGENDVIAKKVTNTGCYVFKKAQLSENDFLAQNGKASSSEATSAFSTHSLQPDNEINKEIDHQIISQLSKMNDLTVDVLNGIVHILMEKSKKTDGEVFLSIDDLLFIRGKKASKNQKGLRGGYKDSQRKEILEHLEILANLKINISNTYIPVIDNNGKRNYEVFSGESPLIYIKKAENKDYYFYVKAGEVLALTLSGAAAKTGLIHKKVSEYDYYRNFWEKRIGNYLAWIWRSRQNNADFLVPLTVGTLLSQIRDEKENKRPQSIRNRLEKALYNLENDLVIKSWQYKEIDEDVLTGKNWFESWLKHKLIIEPPIEILEEYAKIKKIKNNNANKIDFSEIIAIIKEKNLSQMRVAEETGIKHDALAGILTGKMLPNPSEKRKLQTWIMKQKG